jgi:alpha-aminoadipic semialdehyde synthase
VLRLSLILFTFVRALAADVLLLNEIGLDPGIDHCSAISLISKLRAQNKRIISFTSFCGGLPSSDCAEVPLGYKFSWSPRGVLSAALNGARFKLNGKVGASLDHDVF